MKIKSINYVLAQLYADNSIDTTDGMRWDANVTFEELRDEIKLSLHATAWVSRSNFRVKAVNCPTDSLDRITQ